jgi:prepilin signal peptidase PulO-like enzyme (type II secretory pathway)
VPVSYQYPLVELVTALLWVAAALRYGLAWQALSMALFLTILLGIALTDARTYIIPDEFSLGGLLLGLLLALAPGTLSFWQALAGAALGFGILFLAGALGEWWMKKPAMGGGDIKMMAMVGAFLGPLGAVLTIFLGALVGTLVFGPYSLRTGKLVPFGIFLAIGAAVTQAWGGDILRWYAAGRLRGCWDPVTGRVRRSPGPLIARSFRASPLPGSGSWQPHGRRNLFSRSAPRFIAPVARGPSDRAREAPLSPLYGISLLVVQLCTTDGRAAGR